MQYLVFIKWTKFQAEEFSAEKAETSVQSSSLDLNIVITDVDDEMPRCVFPKYEARIAEDAQKRIPLTFVNNANELVVYDNDEASFYLNFEIVTL